MNNFPIICSHIVCVWAPDSEGERPVNQKHSEKTATEAVCKNKNTSLSKYFSLIDNLLIFNWRETVQLRGASTFTFSIKMCKLHIRSCNKITEVKVQH
uniref:Uncharacterized protein n=1 Tax=Anguilla anguilla TaxID=7936 RepID=A0A0E9WU73_ANGAN